MRPVFADPKTDFNFKRIFGSEQDARGALEKAEEVGEVRGLAKGREEGRVEELRRSLADFCELLGIELKDEHHALLVTANLARLERLRDRIMQERRWPAEL